MREGIKILIKKINKAALNAGAAETPICPRKKTDTPSLTPSSPKETAGKNVLANSDFLRTLNGTILQRCFLSLFFFTYAMCCSLLFL